MKDAFDQRPSKVDCLRKFELKAWQTNESFNNYYHEKLILCNLVPIEDAADLIDYLVDGIGGSRQPWVGVCLVPIVFFQKVCKEKS